MKKLSALFILLMSISAEASWHHFDKITKVSILGKTLFVKGSGVTGHTCTNLHNHYGTLGVSNTQDGYKEYYSMALAGYLAGKGLSCHVTAVRADGVCVMTNCSLK